MLKLLIIVIAVELFGCVLIRPIDPYGDQAWAVCEGSADGDSVRVSFDGRTEIVNVHKTDNPDQIYEWCGSGRLGNISQGCTVGNDIFVPSGPTCHRVAAHELGHVFGIPGLDRPRVGKHL
jgi:hypothetical protein